MNACPYEKKCAIPMYIRFPVNVVLNALVFWLPLIAIHFLYLFFVPFSSYMEYSGVHSEKNQYTVGEEINFHFTASIKKDINVIFHDNLYCPKDKRYSQAVVNLYLPKSEYKEDIFHYEWDMPNKPGECKLFVQAIIKLPYGLEKVENFESNQFTIVWQN